MKSIIWDSMIITSPVTVPIRFLLTDFRRAISLSSTAFLALAFLVSMLALQPLTASAHYDSIIAFGLYGFRRN